MSEQKLTPAEQLRREFDQGFAQTPLPPETDQERILLLGSAGERIAVRLTEMRGVLKRGRVVPIRSRAPELLGLAGVRGALIAVFDAAPLLGIPRGSGRAEWLVLAGGEGAAMVALAFDVVAGQAEIAAEAGTQGERHVQAGSAMYRLVELAPVLARLKAFSEREKELL